MSRETAGARQDSRPGAQAGAMPAIRPGLIRRIGGSLGAAAFAAGAATEPLILHAADPATPPPTRAALR